MKWIIKKVVQFVIEALLESDRLDDLLILVAKRIAIPGAVAEAASRVKEGISVIDDIDSTKDIAKMIISRGSKIDMSDISGSSEESVSESDDDKKGVMDILRNLNSGE